jgi:hypothetical protein
MNNIKLSKDIIGIIQKYNMMANKNVIFYKDDYLKELKIFTRGIKHILDNLNTCKYKIESTSYDFRYSIHLLYKKRYIWNLVVISI